MLRRHTTGLEGVKGHLVPAIIRVDFGRLGQEGGRGRVTDLRQSKGHFLQNKKKKDKKGQDAKSSIEDV